MAGICEAGHRSTTDDYCDVCGLPVRPAPDAPVAAAAADAPPSQKCPNCGATNPADALFCEACGYDYTTGTLPRSDAAGMLGLRRPDAATAEPAAAATSSPLDIDAPAAPVPAPDLTPAAPATPTYVPAEPVVATEVEAPAPVAEATPLDTDEPTRGRPAPRRESYVAEVWIDPDWYEVQETDEPMPSVGLPGTVALGQDNLIGRVSTSRGIHPEIDCGVDSGVSRRQSRLSTDGTRWYVEDLGSANGTFVGPAAGPLPTTPIQGRYELGADDRIYVGAWTRIVVRKSSKEEIDALS